MNKSLLGLIILALIAFSCKKEVDPFLISKHHIGLLTDSTQVKDLELVFPNDSIVKPIKGDEFSGSTNDISIYEKGGKELLILAPNQVLDSTAVIKSVQIMDSRYKTEKGISTLSTFKDIDQNYKISRINNLINSIVITVDEINASFTIDKKELSPDLRFDLSLKIEKIQIPDKAKIKYFFVYWN
ncbi:hypothetical protein ACFO5O_00335 [Geojedonia litorea]|uniref:Uncharacterized protein n=1 Tax=Geojedonia litorea TaxID=1268269 RepID=A0ABV9MZK9_9FLAO